MSHTPKIIQIATDNENGVYGLCDDGSLLCVHKGKWSECVDAPSMDKSERDTYRDLCGELLIALKAANQFIGNGIELGYIRMPDRDTPDAAHKTPALVRSAITRAESVMGENSNG